VVIQDEVVADVRVLDVEKQAVADHPLVAELVGRARTGRPAPTAVQARHRRLTDVDSSGVVSLALRALRTFFEKRL
jgi:hypothetical protein